MAAVTGFPLLKELRRRRVFRTAALYVVAVWLLLQAANILFPGWGIPEQAIRYLFLAALAGFPVALVFGWIFQITPEGIQRTPSQWSDDELHAAIPLKRMDYLILAAFVVVVGALILDATSRVLRTAPLAGEEPELRPAEVMENSVAVLPFANLSPDPDQEFLADGISEEILNRLSAFNELKVIARTSSFVFKDSGYDVRRICDLLGVEYLLQGSVRRDNGQLRISSTLVDRGGFQVWHTTLDRELGGIFALQDEIAEAVATNIVPQIAPPPAPLRLPDLAAYEHYLMGRELLAARPPGWVARSQQHFSRAIELDPEFAEAYAERAFALTFDRSWTKDYETVLERAQHDINTALALKPNLARAHAAQVMVQWEREPAETKAREQMLLHILALDPNMVDALNWLAMSYTQQGRRSESEAILRRAARIDPLAPAVNFNLALAESEQGNFVQAEERLLRLLEIPEPAALTFGGLNLLYHKTGRLVDAVQTSKRQILHSAGGESGLEPDVFLELPWKYALLGMREQAEYWQTWAEHRWPEVFFVRLHRSRIYQYTGHIKTGLFAAEFRARLAETGMETDRLPPFFNLVYGGLQALSGEYHGAIATLEPLAGPGRTLPPGTGSVGGHARHALAWAWLQTGEPGQAMALLERIDGNRTQQLAAGEYVSGSNWLADFALNTLMLGDEARAIELFERAVDAGWRDYYLMINDPRWDALREHPRVVDLLARVKADIDQQRALMKQIDAEDDFEAQLDAAIAVRQAEAG